MNSLYQISDKGHDLAIESAVNDYFNEFINHHPERLSGLRVYGILPGDILQWINNHQLCNSWSEEHRSSVIAAIGKVYNNYIIAA
ncbi:MAG: hypothetical protein H0V01_05160 [Bacteroidetes bacterium]|nr:hypothetical protein [Bacteroidota bacterium]HET6244806.1 hypothetical protein [Bacteroidia bacterium]